MPDFKPGQTVQLNDGRKGVVRFAGQTHFQVGEWIGVELEDKTGKNDGSVLAERYFDCPMGYGMFVKPMMVTIVAQPSTARPAAARKPTARPSSFHPGLTRSASGGGDATLMQRRSLNAPSPSPGPKTTSPLVSYLRSPVKSPTKQLSGPPSAAASRTGTPSNTRTPSTGSKTRTSTGGPRSSMGPPSQPASRVARQQTAAAPIHRGASGPARTASTRPPNAGLRALTRSDSGRRPSGDSQTGRESGSTDDALPASPLKSDGDILSPQPKSPVVARAKTLERLVHAAAATPEPAPGPPRRTSAAFPAARAAGGAAAQREIEDLKAKLKVLERKRTEDRDRLKQLDKVQADRDKFESIIQKLQAKYQPQQMENGELKKQLKEAEARFESIEAMQAEHDSALELAALDREMAEETAEVLKMEVDTMKQKAEELELEVEILREENAEYSKGMTAEERASTGWLQMERTNERLREALLRLRDMTQTHEAELRDQIAGLEDELKEFNVVKEEHGATKEKLAQSEAAVDDLRQQLDNALGAEDMIEDLTERNMSRSEQVEELKAVIDDLENLKEINDELEANHVQNEREMQEELDFKDSVIVEQARRAAQQEETVEDMEYTLSRFRELVTSLQSDLEDMRASQAVTEGESEKLNDRTRAMMDLNMKLQISAAKAQVKTIDLELRRLEAQEAEQHLEIVRLFLLDSYGEDRESVLSLLRFRRLAFKAKLVNGFIKERVKGTPQPGQEDDVLAGCDAVDKLVWVTTMCDRFTNDMSHCSLERFSKYQHALHELEPVERALNGWIDGLRRDDLKEKRCADELHRMVALLAHLGEVHMSTDPVNFADETYMRALVIQSHLESAAVAVNTTRVMVQRAMTASEKKGNGGGADETDEADEADEDETLTQKLAKTLEAATIQTRSTKVVAGKAVRAVEELRSWSLALATDTRQAFEQCEAGSQELAEMARRVGLGIHGLLTQDEGRTEPFSYGEIRKAILQAASAGDGDGLSAYRAKLESVNGQMTDLAALAGDLDQTLEYERSTAPWRVRCQELKALKTVPVDAEEELRRLREEHNEARRAIAQRDEQLSTAALKIETLEWRMRDAQANAERIAQLQEQLEATGEQVGGLREDMEKQDRELKSLELERDKWKKIASDSRAAYADGADAAGTKAGQERAVATAREMEALRQEIESLQSAVRFLREDNRRARTGEAQRLEWLAEPLQRTASATEQRRRLVAAEARDALGELVRMAATATVFNFGGLAAGKRAWLRGRATPQHRAACQREDHAAWTAWQRAVVRTSGALRRDGGPGGGGRGGPAAARLRIRLAGGGGGRHGMRVVVDSREWEALQGMREAAECV